MSGREKAPLTGLQRDVISVLKEMEEWRDFYFSGGAALALFHLGHRLSEDLDFFTSTEGLIPIVSSKARKTLEQRSIETETVRSFRSFVEFVARKKGESIKVQLALDTPFRLDGTEVIDGLVVDSLTDIAAGKLLALFGRAAERDFVDIFFLVKEGLFTLEELISKASEKDPGMDKYYLGLAFEQARSLPDDSEGLKLRLLKPVDMKELKRLFVEKAVMLLANGRWNK